MSITNDPIQEWARLYERTYESYLDLFLLEKDKKTGRHPMFCQSVPMLDCGDDYRQEYFKTNNCQAFLEWWMKCYKIREHELFKECWKDLNYYFEAIPRPRNEPDHPKWMIFNQFWVIVCGAIMHIDTTTQSSWKDPNNYSKNYHPLQDHEYKRLYDSMIGGRSSMVDFFPRCTWMKWCSGRREVIENWQGCNHKGFNGRKMNGKFNVFTRSRCPKYGVPAGATDAWCKIDKLFYIMIKGPLPPNTHLESSCEKEGGAVCINPFCPGLSVETGRIKYAKGVKRKRGQNKKPFERLLDGIRSRAGHYEMMQADTEGFFSFFRAHFAN